MAVNRTVICDLLVLAPDSLLHHMTFLSTKYFWAELLYIETQNLGISFAKVPYLCHAISSNLFFGTSAIVYQYCLAQGSTTSVSQRSDWISS